MQSEIRERKKKVKRKKVIFSQEICYKNQNKKHVLKIKTGMIPCVRCSFLFIFIYLIKEGIGNKGGRR